MGLTTTLAGCVAMTAALCGCGNFGKQEICLPNANDCAVPTYSQRPSDLPSLNGPNPEYVDCNAFRDEYDNGAPVNADACKPKMGAHAGRIGGVESSKIPVLINEVLADPVGSNTSRQRIELWNVGKLDFDLSGYVVDTDGGRATFADGTLLVTGGFLTIHVGETGLDGTTDVFFSSVSSLDADQGYVALVAPSGMIADYVQWGTAGQRMEQFAALEGQWASGTYCMPPAEGYSLVFAGVGNLPRDFAAAEPSIGKPN